MDICMFSIRANLQTLQYFLCFHSYTHTPTIVASLSSWWWIVHHLGLLLLEPLTDSLTSSHELLHASCYAARLALNERFGRKIVDAGIEAV